MRYPNAHHLAKTLLLLMLTYSTATLPHAAAAKPKAPKIRIAKETTFFKGPLRKDGRVDYFAAINAHASRGVTADNNAAVLLVRSLDPAVIPRSIRKNFYGALGIAIPANGGRHFRTMGAFAKLTAGANSKAYREKLFDEQGKAMGRLWTRREFPRLAAWIDHNREPLKLVHAAALRPRYYNPLVPGEGDKDTDADTLLAALLPAVQEWRSFARILSARALLAAAEGRTADAQRDLLTGHRLARHASTGQTLIEGLVGYAIEAITFQSSVALLQSGKLTERELAAFQQALRKLPRLSPVSEKINIAERCMALDALCLVSRRGPNALKLIKDLVSTELVPALEYVSATALPALVQGGQAEKAQIAFTKAVDWSAVLVAINKEYDRLYAMAKLPTYTQRRDAAAQFVERLKGYKTEAQQQLREMSRGFITNGKVDRKLATSTMSKLFVSLFAPAVHQARVAEDRNVARTELLPVAVALERFRLANGRFPDKLDAITPKFLAKIPHDLYSGKPLVYRRTNKGYRLYMIGDNLKDDGGETFGSKSGGDDIVVNVEMKK